MRNRLLYLLQRDAYRRGDFTLSSGEKSNHYIDARISTLSSESLGIIAEIFYSKISERGISFVGGPTIGADPIVGAILNKSYSKNKVNMFGSRFPNPDLRLRLRGRHFA